MIEHKIILTDIDGVCLYWLAAFERYMRHQGYKVSNKPHKHYDLTDHFGLESQDDTLKHISAFNAGAWEFGTLPAVSGAKDGINQLVNEGFRFVGISACSTGSQTMALRRANLYHVFGDVFDDMFFVPLKTPKHEYLKRYEPTWWLEDKHSSAVDGLAHGHRPILLDYDSNRDPDPQGLYRAQNWADAVDYILENT